MTALAFVAAAAAGTLVRALVGFRLNRPSWPWGTLLVNVVGSFLLALLANADMRTVTIFGAGALGSLTTYSTFSVEVTRLGWRSGAAYAATTVVLAVGAALAGTLVV